MRLDEGVRSLRQLNQADHESDLPTFARLTGSMSVGRKCSCTAIEEGRRRVGKGQQWWLWESGWPQSPRKMSSLSFGDRQNQVAFNVSEVLALQWY